MKVKVLKPFITKAHRVIGKVDDIINMPEEDYKEVQDKVKVIEKKVKKEQNKMIKNYENKEIK